LLNKTLTAWDDWAVKYRRYDMRPAIWACDDVLRGCKDEGQLARCKEFLASRKPSRELDELKKLIGEIK